MNCSRFTVLSAAALAIPVLWLLPCGCGSPQRESFERRGGATTARLLSTNPVPIEIEGDHVFVTGTLNGHAVRFVLDTGASHIAVSPEVAAAAGIRKTEQARFGAFGDVRGSGNLGVAESVAVGSAVAVKVPTFIIPITPIFQDGFLGLSFLKHFTFRLDYQHKLLYFASLTSTNLIGSGYSVPLQVEDARLALQVEVDGIPARLIVDTGAGHGLILESWFVKEAKMRDRYPERLKVETGGDLLGPIRGEIVRLRALKLGGYTLTNELVVFDTEVNMRRGEFAGLIGAGILRRFDLTGRRLWIEPNAGYAQEPLPSAVVRSGLVCSPEGTVQDVVPDSPAAEAGVRKGDRLLEVNGVSVQSLKFEEIKRALRNEPGTRVQLRLQSSGDAPRDLTLTLRDLL